MSLRVNGEEITASELEAECRRLEQAGRRGRPGEPAAARPQLQAQARELAIGRRLLLQEARRRELAVTDEQLAGGLLPMIHAAGGPAAWTARVRSGQINYRDVCRQLTEALLVEAAAREITRPIPPPGEDEIAFYYAQHAAELGDRTAGEPPALAAVREKISNRLWRERRNRALEAFVAHLRDAAEIETEEQSVE